MHTATTTRGAVWLLISCLVVSLGSSCATKLSRSDNASATTVATPATGGSGGTDAALPPRIYNIGTQSELVFSHTSAPSSTAVGLEIPIEGTGLKAAATGSKKLTVAVTGTVPPEGSDIGYSWESSCEEMKPLRIQLRRSYLNRLKTGDRLKVSISVKRASSSYQKGVYPFKMPETVVSAHRDFVFYELDDYRKQVIANRVSPADMEAFPLPDSDVRYLFGPLVMKNYFVVRLTLRNTTSTDKLVNTTLIRATGRALVVPVDETEPSFTVPVRVSPQGPVQVYTVLDDRGEFYPRAWVFRSLEFIGALGTAATKAFSGGPADLSDGLLLLTGIAIPEAKRLWPDTWPGYKRNLVAFSMPELAKIPPQSTTQPRYIFFPKRELALLVSDQTTTRPNVRIISIGFDSLDIPFENVAPTSATEGSPAHRVGKAIVDWTHESNAVEATLSRWKSGQEVVSGKSYDVLDKPLERITTTVAVLKKEDTDPEATALRSKLAQLQRNVEELKGTKGPSDLNNDFLARVTAQQAALAPYNKTLEGLPARVLSTAEADGVERDLKAIQNALAESQTLRGYIESIVTYVTRPKFSDELNSVLTSDATANPSRKQMTAELTDLLSNRYAMPSRAPSP